MRFTSFNFIEIIDEILYIVLVFVKMIVWVFESRLYLARFIVEYMLVIFHNS